MFGLFYLQIYKKNVLRDYNKDYFTTYTDYSIASLPYTYKPPCNPCTTP